VTFTHYVGCDLGQAQDPTAVCVLEDPLWVRTEWAQALFLEATGWVPVDQLQGNQREQVRALNYHHGRPSNPPLALRHLERLPLQTSYPDVVQHLVALLAQPQLPADSTVLIVDATGCGRPVVDMMRLAGLAPVAVTITAGTAITVDLETSALRVPKRDLVSTMAVLLEQRRLGIADSLPEAGALRHELQTFRRKVTPDGDDSYSSWRERDHDDLVLATALACWYRQWWNERIDLANARNERSA
jgi:hypothetical protein